MRVKFSENQDQQMSVTFVSVSDGIDQFWVRLYGEKDETLYGGGEQFTYLNLKGKMFPIWTREQGKTRLG